MSRCGGLISHQLDRILTPLTAIVKHLISTGEDGSEALKDWGKKTP